MWIVEYDITSNIATWNLKVKLFPNEIPTGDLLLTLDNKLIVLSKTLTNTKYYISQFNYNTGTLEFRSEISPTITSDCGLAEINGEIYIMGYNIYKFNRTTYALELTQSPQTQLVASSQLASCINVNLPTSSCPECKGLPLKLSTPVTYGGVTISPTYIGELVAPPDYRGATDTLYPGPFVSCTGSSVITFPSFSAWLGAGTAGQGNQSPYTYSLNFSEPVNDIKLTYGGTDGTPPETFIWNTNVGTPNISLCKGCYQTVNGNIVSGTWQFNPPPDPIPGGGVITISAPLNYTTLTLRGSGTNLGTIFGICSGSVIPRPANALGCVYSSDAQGTYLYNISNNAYTPVTLPIDQQPNPILNWGAETHTLSKYWRGNNYNTIKEWNATSTPNVLALNRTISVQGIPFPSSGGFFKFFDSLQAIDDTTLLVCMSTTVPQTSANIYLGQWVNTMTLFDITTNTVGSAQQTPLFTVFAPGGGLDAFLLTTNNKLITIGRRGNGVNTNNYYNWYLSQYSYPDGALELDVSLDTYLPSPGNGASYLVSLFESNNGKLYVKVDPSAALQSKIYEINLNSPYILTQVWDDASKRAFYTNSSINCNTVALNTQPVTDLGCVYYHTSQGTYLYNVATNNSIITTLPVDALQTFDDTHTLTKYWRGNRINAVREWVPSNVPNALTLNRTIDFNTGYANFYYLQAINNTTLLTLFTNNTSDQNGNLISTLASVDVTGNTVTSAQITPLFNIPSTSLGAGAMLLTSTNKLLFIGTRFNPSNNELISYLRQYSYPDGTLETEVDLSSLGAIGVNSIFGLFESGGEIFLSQSPIPINATNIYKININSPYLITPVWTNIPFGSAGYNSSINCNTVALNPAPSPPAPTPSLTPPVSPNVGVNTIYKYLDIL